MKQLTTYLPDDVYATMTSLAGENESVNGYIRAAVEAENHRRLFTGMDEAIAAVVRADEAAAWHAANAAMVQVRDDAAQG